MSVSLSCWGTSLCSFGKLSSSYVRPVLKYACLSRTDCWKPKKFWCSKDRRPVLQVVSCVSTGMRPSLLFLKNSNSNCLVGEGKCFAAIWLCFTGCFRIVSLLCLKSLPHFRKTEMHMQTRKLLDVLLPSPTLAKYAKSFFFRAALLWNSLPNSLQSICLAQEFRGPWKPWSANERSVAQSLLIILYTQMDENIVFIIDIREKRERERERLGMTFRPLGFLQNL